MLQYLGIIQKLGAMVMSPFNKAQERKANKASGETKLRQMKESGDNSIKLTDAEWEAIAAKGMLASWKDEYLTVIITSPIPMLIVGGVVLAFTNDDRLLTGTVAGIKAIEETGVDMGFLMNAVVLSGVGLKVWRAK